MYSGTKWIEKSVVLSSLVLSLSLVLCHPLCSVATLRITLLSILLLLLSSDSIRTKARRSALYEFEHVKCVLLCSRFLITFLTQLYS